MPKTPLHSRVQRPTEEGQHDPIADLKECGDAYERLEECLAEADRDYTKCQAQVRAVRACMLKQADYRAALGDEASKSVHN